MKSAVPFYMRDKIGSVVTALIENYPKKEKMFFGKRMQDGQQQRSSQ